MQIQKIQNFSKPLVVGEDQELFWFVDTIPNGEIILKKNSKLFLIGLISDGWEQDRRLEIKAKAIGAKCEVLFFILGKNNSNFSAKIEAYHQAPKTQIKASLRMALADKSSGHIEGNWKIEKGANGANAYFSHHTLLLSEDAKAKTSPNLEIKTDDVKAGHSASVGKIDEDALFYLLSRGLDEISARTLLVEGFFEKDIIQIPDHRLSGTSPHGDGEKIKNKIREAVKSFLD